MSAEPSVGSRVRDRQALRLVAFSVLLGGLMVLSIAAPSFTLPGGAEGAPSFMLQIGLPFFVALVSLLNLMRAIILAVMWKTTTMLVVAMASHGVLLSLCVVVLSM